jgi:AmmeMemoRadiSam system protein B
METVDIIGKNRAEVLSYTDSGNVTGDTSSVVGYLSAVVYGEE